MLSSPRASCRVRRPALSALALSVLAPLAALLTPTAATAAAPPAPVVQNPTSEAGTGIPVLHWNRVPGVSTYVVQVGSSSEVTTYNNSFVPMSVPSSGALTWRVKSRGAGGDSDWATGSLTNDTSTGPTPLAPAEGADLQPPADVPHMSWTAVPGAQDYTLEVSRNSNFDAPFTMTVTSTRAVAGTLTSGRYHWRVRARVAPGVFSAWSAPRTFRLLTVGGTQRVSPATDTTVQENVVFDWNPVPGAVTYDIQFSPDEEFRTDLRAENAVQGTRYSPNVTLANDEYYWKVRPRDVNGNAPDWNQVPLWRFQRRWAEQPRLVHPADGSSANDPFYFQWKPVRLASRYRVQVSTASTFPVDHRTRECETVNTTLTVSDQTVHCMPAALGFYYWRVLALDDPGSVITEGTEAEVRSFNYVPEIPTQTAPVANANVTVPTMTWQPQTGAVRYVVRWTNTETGASGEDYTTGLSYTPAHVSPGTYRWSVTTMDVWGRLGATLTASSQPRFTLNFPAQSTLTSVTPNPTNTTQQRWPSLTWNWVKDSTAQPAPGEPQHATFSVWMRPLGAVSAGTQISGLQRFPAFTPKSGDMAPGTYEWRVETYHANGASQGFSPWSQFTLSPLAPASGHSAGLTGEKVTAGTPGEVCSSSLPSACQNLRATPVLGWDTTAPIGYWEVYLSRDAALTNTIGTPIKTSRPLFMPVTALPESQAGSGYFWYARPCYADGSCGVKTQAQHAFNKLSNGVELIGTGDTCTTGAPAAATEADDVTLCWKDFLLTNQDRPQGTSAISTKADTSARMYEVQTATSDRINSAGDFTDLIETQHVDQTTFTSFRTTYPEGNVYWRVRAWDGSNNPLAWSEIRTFLKQSPTPVLTVPAPGATVAGDTQLSWQALNYAADYEVEVFRNGDTAANPANLVARDITSQATHVLRGPLDLGTYAWRVRRRDGSGRYGGYSPFRTFTVEGQRPTLTAPANGAEILPNQSLFVWDPVLGAANYKLQTSPAGANTWSDLPYAPFSPALAFAPIHVFPDGDYDWRVVAYHTQGRELGVSESRRFTVNGKLTATEKPRVEGSGAKGVQLTAFAPSWNRPGVTNSYQWLRNGWPIEGATGLSYLVTEHDVAQVLSVRVTGTHPNYASGSVDSNTINGSLAPAPGVLDSPQITGTGKVGTSLELTVPARWDTTNNVLLSYQWLRNGSEIWGETNTAYQVRLEDDEKSLQLRVTGKVAGHSDSVLLTNAVVASPGAAVVATRQVTLTGTPKVGATLSATAPEWDQPGVQTRFEWLRNGVAIPNATSPSYQVTVQDVGTQLSVRVTGTRAGMFPGVSTSAAMSVPKVATSVEFAAPTPTVPARTRLVLSVRVLGDGAAVQGGRVKFMDKKKVLKTVKVKADGTAVFRTKKLKKGKRKFRAVYVPANGFAGSSSKKFKVVVTR